MIAEIVSLITWPVLIVVTYYLVRWTLKKFDDKLI
jgi:hypothetical protein